MKYIVFLLGLFSIIFISGCDKYTQHKVLTFFFTGVPPIEEEKAAPEDKTEGSTEAKKEAGFIPHMGTFSHGPFGAGQCYYCHETYETVGFRKFGYKKPDDAPKQGQGISGRLVMPLRKLCLNCHVQKSIQSAFENSLYLHGPVAEGSCTICHNPHMSSSPYMLLKEKTTELCTQCHSKGYIQETEGHVKGEECTACHNAHMGADSFLLKKDFDEAF